jgi:MFS family permease
VSRLARPSSPGSGPAGLRSRSDRLLLLVLALGVLLAFASALMVFTLFGQIGASLHLSRAALNWLAIVSAIVGAVGSGLFPAIGSIIGQRRTLVLAMGCLALGSLLSAVAPGFWLLILGRVVASFGGAAAIVGVALAREQRPGPALPRALGVIGAAEGAAAGVGFGLGGTIEAFAGDDWRAVFWVMALLAALVTALMAAVLPKAASRVVRRLDLTGALLLVAGLVALLLPVTQGGNWGWSSAGVIALFAAAAILLGSWVWRELAIREPIIALRVLGRRPVLAGCAVATVVGATVGLFNVTVPAFLATARSAGYGLAESVLGSGLALVPFSLAIATAALLSGIIIARLGLAATAAAGFLAEAAGLGLLGLFHGSALQVILLAACFGAGHGTLLPAMYTLISDVPADEVGGSAAIAGSLSSIGSAVVTAAVTAVLVSRTVTSNGAVVPAVTGYRASWALGAGLAGIGVVIAAVFGRTGRPRRGSRGEGTQTRPGQVNRTLLP